MCIRDSRKYLGSGLVPGIGEKYARRIVEKFGADTPVSYTHLDVYKRQAW